MRLALLLLVAVAASACSGQRVAGVAPIPAGESKSDGIVTMASTGTIWNPVSPDWRDAQAAADKRCRAWGYDGAQSYAGSQEACRVYDLYGRCVQTKVTRFYPCGG